MIIDWTGQPFDDREAGKLVNHAKSKDFVLSFFERAVVIQEFAAR